MTEQFVNNAQSTLNGAIDAAVVAVTLTSAAAMPATGTWSLLIDAELMTVTSVAGNVLTVTRGAEGTAAAAHLNGAPATFIVTARGYNQLKADAAASVLSGRPIELYFAAALQSSTLNSYARKGGRLIDMTPYPATLFGLTRTVKFACDMDIGASAATGVTVKLWNITDNEEVTGTELTSASALQDSEESAALTVGNAAGNIRSDHSAQYYPLMKMDGGTENTDYVYLVNSRLVITYA